MAFLRAVLGLGVLLWGGLLDAVEEERPQPLEKRSQRRRAAYRDPLALTGVAPSREQLEDAAARGVEFLLSRQRPDGSWRIDFKAIEKEVGPNQIQRADYHSSDHVITALCCMALRAHQAIAPERVEEAVRNGTRYLLDVEARSMQDSTIWTWLFCVDFLAQEHDRVQDADLRQGIFQKARELVRKLLADPRRGQLLAAKYDLPEERSAPAEAEGQVPGSAEAPPLCWGGWFYYLTPPLPPTAQEGGGATFITADVILAFLEARRIGIEIPLQAILAAARCLETARSTGPSGDIAYAYSAVPKNVPADQAKRSEKAEETPGDKPRRPRARQKDPSKIWEDGMRGVQGRTPVCELALVRAGQRSRQELAQVLESFLKYRPYLDRVKDKLDSHHEYSNAAYYYFYTHFHAAQASHEIEDPDLKRRVQTAVQEVVFLTQELDGTWRDHRAWGPLYGTPMALLALAEARK